MRKRKRNDTSRVGRSSQISVGSVSRASSRKKWKTNRTNHFGGMSQNTLLKMDPLQKGLEKLAGSRFRFLNEQLYTTTGAEAFEYFQRNPEAFRCYHNGFSMQVQKWPKNPLESIIKWLRTMPRGSVVLDMGCGDAKLSRSLSDTHVIHSYDLVAMNSLVVACDMAHLPLKASYADIAVFCLSLMGSNLVDYIREARRVLKCGGILKIAEVTSRFVSVNLFCNAVCMMGFEIIEKKLTSNYFILLEFRKVEKKENRRPFGLRLKPCLYKRR